MDIKSVFDFLIKEYEFEYACQKFEIGNGWLIEAHSFYNRTGCFTIHSMETRGELDFYYAKRFSMDRNRLYERGINIYSVEKSIWDKYGKIGFIPNLFFWWNNERILKVAAIVIKTQIMKHGEFFGIRIIEDDEAVYHS